VTFSKESASRICIPGSLRILIL